MTLSSSLLSFVTRGAPGRQCKGKGMPGSVVRAPTSRPCPAPLPRPPARLPACAPACQLPASPTQHSREQNVMWMRACAQACPLHLVAYVCGCLSARQPAQPSEPASNLLPLPVLHQPASQQLHCQCHFPAPPPSVQPPVQPSCPVPTRNSPHCTAWPLLCSALPAAFSLARSLHILITRPPIQLDFPVHLLTHPSIHASHWCWSSLPHLTRWFLASLLLLALSPSPPLL